MSRKIGILAYGSLIDEPGYEIAYHTSERIEKVPTPFHIEFCRTSSKRNGGPTVIPVTEGGAKVNAQIIVLNAIVTLNDAMDMLYRRETGNVGDKSKKYSPPENPTKNNVLVENLSNFAGVDTVFYTRIGKNIDNPTPDSLAELAINSAKDEVSRKGKGRCTGDNGISYLISLKEQGIETPLMPKYEQAILEKTKTKTLAEALEKARTDLD